MARELVQRPVVGGQRRAMGYEEWLSWAGDAEFKSEWVDGEAVVFVSTKVLHARLSGFLFVLLSQYVRLARLGEVLAETVEMRLGRVSRVPDILFLAREHRDRLTPERLVGPARPRRRARLRR
jgi:Uma2 family endonuclease